jgi:hypothetical protein
MAVKKNFNDGNFSWQDVFDTQEALDTGILGYATAGTLTETNTDKFRDTKDSLTSDVQTKDLGSMLNMQGNIGAQEGIDAYRRRKLDQAKLSKQQGTGQSQSILGGSNS